MDPHTVFDLCFLVGVVAVRELASEVLLHITLGLCVSCGFARRWIRPQNVSGG